MRKLFKIFLTFGIAVSFNSCKKENLGDCFKTAGKTETDTRYLNGFCRIKVEDKLELYLTQGNYYEVKVEAGKNLLSNIKTIVIDSTLTISNINKCNFVRSPKTTIRVYVTLPSLRFIRNGGVGPVYFENQFAGDSLDIRIGNSGDIHANIDMKYLATSTHGNGDLYVTGKVDFSSHYTNGTNFLHLEELIIKDKIILNTYTIGDCFINAPINGPMEVEIWESGNIYYTGTPTYFVLNQKGNGQLIQQ